MSSPNPSQNEAAKQILWDDPKLAAGYKTTEQLTGEYAHDLCLQMGIQSHHAPINFLDLACGIGIVVKKALAILQTSQPARPLPQDKFTFADISAEMLKTIRSRVVSENWPISEEAKTMEVVEVDMTDTKLPPDTYTHVGCNFGPANAHDPDRTLGECYRVLKPGGMAGWSLWQSVGWEPDMARAVADIRESAARRCTEGHGTDEDQKLSKIPHTLTFEDMIAGWAGVDHDKLRAEGVDEAQLPRWDNEDWFGSRVEEAGFVDVNISIVEKASTLRVQDVYSMVQPLVNMLSTFWTERQRQDLRGADLRGRVKEWFDEHLVVREGKVDGWDGWRAMVVTAKKPA